MTLTMGLDVPLSFQPSRSEDDATGGERRVALLRRRASLRRALLAVAVSTLLACLTPAGAQATTFTVTSNADSGPGTLRGLLASAGAGDTILVPGSFTITLATPLTVTQPGPQGVTIAATGSGMPTISGGNITRIFSLNASSALTLNGLLLTGGRGGGDGNAIQGFSGSAVAINDSVLSDNGSGAATGDGGAIQMNAPGTVTIQRSSLVSNFGGTSSGNGGAIQMNAPGTLTISQSTLAGNRAGPATGNGGAIQMNAPGTLNLTNATLFDNSAGGDGGAIQLNTPGTGSILNATIAGNRATGPSSDGGGIQTNSGPSNSLSFKNTIVSGNASPNGTNCASTTPPLASLGHNLENGTSCGFSAFGDLNADPGLDTQLRANGGPTSTLALLPASIAIDSGDNNGCPDSDQRGQVRPADGDTGRGTICDIGAFELVPACQGKAPTIVARLGQTTNGTPGPDVIVGTDKRDVINAGRGKDAVCARSGNDKVSGGAGKDSLNGDQGKDRIAGGKGNDTEKGGKGKDKLFGNKGKDKLKGGPGKDKLFGGRGLDVLLGGPGKDTQKQ